MATSEAPYKLPWIPAYRMYAVEDTTLTAAVLRVSGALFVCLAGALFIPHLGLLFGLAALVFTLILIGVRWWAAELVCMACVSVVPGFAHLVFWLALFVAVILAIAFHWANPRIREIQKKHST